MVASTWPKTLQQAIVYFSNPEVAHAEMVKFRWPDGVVRCPQCGSDKVWYTASRRVWQCAEGKHLRRQFTVKVGSIMEDSPLGIDKWLIALWLIVNCKNGISSYELHRDIGVTQKTAWFMLHRIRLAMQEDGGGKIAGEVEVDETYIGGAARFMHKEKRRRVQPGRSTTGKVAVMGLLSRHTEKGKSRMRYTMLGRSLRKHNVQGKVREHVEAGSTLNTDAYPSYEGLSADYIHNVIDHAEAYVRGQVHTNGCENFWSLLKRALKGTYVSVEPFHLFRYLDEQCFRFNQRTLTDAERFVLTAASAFGKRLTFKQLTAADATC
jgi:transposase-like protein